MHRCPPRTKTSFRRGPSFPFHLRPKSCPSTPSSLAVAQAWQLQRLISPRRPFVSCTGFCFFYERMWLTWKTSASAHLYWKKSSGRLRSNQKKRRLSGRDNRSTTAGKVEALPPLHCGGVFLPFVITAE